MKLVLGIIVIAAVSRLIPHPPNFAPISAIALFGGAYLPKKLAFTLPLIVMVISDIFLGFHSTLLWVYGSFLLISLVGMYLKNHVSPLTVILSAVTASFIFYFVTNFGVWVTGSMYPHTLPGLIYCYFNALPFLRNTMLGDLFYTISIFAVYNWRVLKRPGVITAVS